MTRTKATSAKSASTRRALNSKGQAIVSVARTPTPKFERFELERPENIRICNASMPRADGFAFPHLATPPRG